MCKKAQQGQSPSLRQSRVDTLNGTAAHQHRQEVFVGDGRRQDYSSYRVSIALGIKRHTRQTL